MKKLFFSALLATVAVGGALSTQADTYWGPESEVPQKVYHCETDGNLCSEISGNIYTTATNQGSPVVKTGLTTRFIPQ